jgi:hypothetical protein|tara:strand:+ start:393 stop:545 length:153 start_codon:yes stop_codon:yes gene_type:complete
LKELHWEFVVVNRVDRGIVIRIIVVWWIGEVVWLESDCEEVEEWVSEVLR